MRFPTDSQNCDRRSAHRQIRKTLHMHRKCRLIVNKSGQPDREKDASDLIICPTLCYSNGTDDKGVKIWD